MKKYTRLLDTCILWYLLFNIVYNLFGWIVPVKLVTPTNIDALIYAVMGLLGAFLVAADVWMNEYWKKTRYCWVLYAFLIVMALSTMLNLSYGYMSNVKTIVWTVIQFTLFYSLHLRIDKDKAMEYFGKLWLIIAALWILPVLYSIWQFMLLESYYVQIWGKYMKQGFIENRLFGIFNDPNYAAMLCLLLIIGMFFLYNRTDKRWKKNSYLAYGILQFIYIVLSGSRTVEIGLVVTVAVFVYIWMRNRNLELKGIKVFINRGMAALLSVVIVLVLWEGTNGIFERIPKALGGMAWFQEYTEGVHEKINTTKGVKNANLKYTNKTKNLLQRLDGQKGNVSNNRIHIWTSYLSGMDRHLLLGMSPRNVVQVFVDENPNSFIAETKYETHNGYLSVFVCTGIAGSLIMLLFILLQGRDVCKIVFRRTFLSVECLSCILVVGNIALFAFFFTDLFFVNNILATLFWTLLGMIRYWSTEDEIS